MQDVKLVPCGDAAFALRFEAPFSLPQHDRLLSVLQALDATPPAAIRDIVPGHLQILVVFDPGQSDGQDVLAHIRAAMAAATDNLAAGMRRRRHVPVCFAAEFGLDLGNLALHVELSPAQIIEIFTAPVYRCTVVGFRPGFPYLVGLDPRLRAHRHPTPRPRVPAGSVGIAQDQAGIYPVDGPGGWQILGRTPLHMFDAQRATCFIAPGDEVVFEPIDAAAFAKLRQ